MAGAVILVLAAWVARDFHDFTQNATTLGFGIILAAALSLGGGAFLIYGTVLFLCGRSETKARRLAPDQPWLWRRDWATGRIVSTSGKRLFLLWGLALAMLAVTALLCPLMVETIHEEAGQVWKAAPLPVCVMILLALAISDTVRRIKFGPSVFHMLHTPARPGGMLAGAVEIPAKIRAADGFKLTCKCVRPPRTAAYTRGVEEVLWQSEQYATRDVLENEARRTGVPIRFKIPANLPISASWASATVLWLLELQASLPGVNYTAQFKVPVFRAEPESPSPELLAILPGPALQWILDLYEFPLK